MIATAFSGGSPKLGQVFLWPHGISAGDLRIFFQVIIPLCLPALGTCAVFGFLMIWDQYLLPLLVAQTPRMNTLTLIVTSLQASQEQGEGVRLAAAVVLMVPSVLVYL